MTRLPQAGFTLIELVTTAAILALMTGLLLPAIQASREAARRSECQAHLHQLGLALASYEAIQRELPPGRDARQGWQHAWCTRLLPYLEQRELLLRYDFRRVWDDGQNGTVARSDLRLFRCPSAVDNWPGKSDYGGNYGSALTGLTPGFQRGFAWESGTLLPVHVPLPGNYRRSPVRLREVKDGTSHTFTVLEDVDRPPEEGGMWANGHNCFAHDEGPVNSQKSNEIFSQHPNGALGLLGDGSVRFLSDSMAVTVVGALCTRASSEATHES